MQTVKSFLVVALVLGSAGLVRADEITLSFNLSNLNAGSVLSGSADISGPLLPGDSTDINLSFSDPSDYSPASLSTVLMAQTGTFGIAMRFSEITFEDLTDDKIIHLTVYAPAQCVVDPGAPQGVPCDTPGLWGDGDPPEYTGRYTVTEEMSAVPEPAYGLFLGLGLAALAYRRRRSPIA